MRVNTLKQFVCGECNRIYQNKDNALACEVSDKKDKKRENCEFFEVKEEHIKLLKEMNVHWDDCEFGAPCIDPKRPYGNSDGVDDVARVIGYLKTENTVDFDKEEASQYDDVDEYLDDCDWNDESYDYLMDLHKDMRVVLQIVLSSLSFSKGKYKLKEKYGYEWEKV